MRVEMSEHEAWLVAQALMRLQRRTTRRWRFTDEDAAALVDVAERLTDQIIAQPAGVPEDDPRQLVLVLYDRQREAQRIERIVHLIYAELGTPPVVRRLAINGGSALDLAEALDHAAEGGYPIAIEYDEALTAYRLAKAAEARTKAHA